VGGTLTKEQAIKECPDVEISAIDEAWMREVLDSVVDRSCLDGEYTLEELDLSPHPEYGSARVNIKTSSVTDWSTGEESNRMRVTMSFDPIAEKSGKVNITMSSYGKPDTYESKKYGELSFGKCIEYFKNSIFRKDGFYDLIFPDTKYSSNSAGEYSKLYLKHKCFAIIRDFFTPE
jgi:hypothetical protein